MPGVLRIADAYCYRCRSACVTRAACRRRAGKMIAREGADTIAAFIAEPVKASAV
jgi:adenosylmethionine-8-amino-7-oxononanoate aminotransferase